MWQKPSAQYCDSAACVEVASGGSGVLLRATGAPETMVELTPEEFSAFIQAVKGGEYDNYVRVL